MGSKLTPRSEFGITFKKAPLRQIMLPVLTKKETVAIQKFCSKILAYPCSLKVKHLSILKKRKHPLVLFSKKSMNIRMLHLADEQGTHRCL